MANPEHLQILKEGAEAWNQWRDQHRDITPDLDGADLDGAVLDGVDLSSTDLTGATFSGFLALREGKCGQRQ